MKFARLRLAAFLSFKEKTEIDFAQFGNQLMLLFGGSGVGKTAIFDGITFALYGRGSGKDRCAGKVARKTAGFHHAWKAFIHPSVNLRD